MAAKGKGLGRGISSLLGNVGELDTKKLVEEVTAEEEKTAMTVKLRDVEPNRDQPRTDFNEAELNELTESIRIHGVITPLIVVKDGNHYKIIAGERRWRAAKLAGLKEVPVIIRDYTEREIAEISLIENLQRSDLNPVEEAEAFEKLMQSYDLTQEELAERISRSRSAVANSLRLLKLPKEVRKMVAEGRISTGHAKVLLGLSSEEEQIGLAGLIEENSMSVRETEDYLKKNKAKEEKPPKKVLPNETAYADAENLLKEKLGTKVHIRRSKENAGRIEIDFYSLEEIERILKHIN